MNGTYYENPTFPDARDESDEERKNYFKENIIENTIKDKIPEPGIDYLPQEQSYIENILRLNKGANAQVYATFPDSSNFRDKIFSGKIEQAGRDHLVMSLDNGKWVLIPSIYLDYFEFDKIIKYRPYEINEQEKQTDE